LGKSGRAPLFGMVIKAPPRTYLLDDRPGWLTFLRSPFPVTPKSCILHPQWFLETWSSRTSVATAGETSISWWPHWTAPGARQHRLLSGHGPVTTVGVKASIFLNRLALWIIYYKGTL
jgi:hypothetical protein